MLVKQWWRILHNQESICYKVLQVRYFPRSTPIKALRGSNSSYMWKSLLAGKKVVDQGTIWRVGDGFSIDVWQDKWLKKPPTYIANPPINNSPTPLLVANLINSEQKGWNMEMG